MGVHDHHIHNVHIAYRALATHPHAILYASSRRLFWGGLAALFLWLAQPTYAQVGKIWAPERLSTQQQTNAFFSWSGTQHLNGLWIEVPTGWAVKAVAAIEPHRMHRIPLDIQQRGRTFKAEAPDGLNGPYTFMVQFRTGNTAGNMEWRVTPFVRTQTAKQTPIRRLESHRLKQRVHLKRHVDVSDNRVLSLNPAGDLIQIRHSVLHGLDHRQPFTVEFWMQTTALDHVVLSTWNGTPQQAYPFEFVIDTRGHLQSYRGEPGRHESLTTPRPVADGTWHHIALVSEQNTLRLLLNGITVDSLSSNLVTSFNASPVTIGGRAGQAKDSMHRYTGLLDEVRIWNRSRSDREVQQTMHVPMKSDPASHLTLSFEDTLPRNILETSNPTWTATRSDLSFQYPVRRMRAIPEQGTISIEWHLQTAQPQTMELERSFDGQTFTPIYTRTLTPTEARQLDTNALFTFFDQHAFGNARVCFYRIRQRFEDGNVLTSKTVKVGMGTEEVPTSVRLLGNWPNPFSTSTLIRYELEETQHVHISVWSISGHQIQTLVSDQRDPGQHEVRFDATALPSGTYFVHLQTRQGEQTLKMLHTK